jgi:transposase
MPVRGVDLRWFRVIQVNPAYTSQTCSGCGYCDKKFGNWIGSYVCDVVWNSTPISMRRG